MGESSVYLDLGKSTLINLKNNYKIFFLDNVDMCSSFDRSKIFEILNLTHITGNRIVMSSLISVNNLINLSFKTDLISRLKQGLIYELNELGDDLKKDLLRRHLQKLGWINNEYDKSYDYLLSYMLHHLPRELGKLKVILDNLNYVSISNKQAVSINLVKQMISK
ncbi:MAG: hypothetical protein CBC42_03625 [Betaproteobacteria bacterium TMED82]|nr:MAG: hypothetical protein CBC42_03625 [Betaproteobacteria bacterium TMED82]